MNAKPSVGKFQQRIKRGRAFEKWERDHWIGDLNSLADFESPTRWKGKRGRIDIKLVDNDEDHAIIVELKATRNSHWLFGAGFIGAMIALVMDQSVNMMFAIILISGVFSEVIENLSKIYYYRKGI